MKKTIVAVAATTAVLALAGCDYEPTEAEMQQAIDEEAKIYQEYCPAGSLRDGTNFIVSVWMEGGSPVTKLAKATNIAIREFDTHVSNVQNERFVPHVVVG